MLLKSKILTAHAFCVSISSILIMIVIQTNLVNQKLCLKVLVCGPYPDKQTDLLLNPVFEKLPCPKEKTSNKP